MQTLRKKVKKPHLWNTTLLTIETFTTFNINYYKKEKSMNCDDPIQILTSLPYNYTVEMALSNNNVLRTPEGKAYNIKLLYNFINNVNSVVKDCILITYFGLDGPAQTSILKYNGDTITLYTDNSRFSDIHNDTYSNVITEIYSETKNVHGITVQNFYGVTKEALRLTIFSRIL